MVEGDGDVLELELGRESTKYSAGESSFNSWKENRGIDLGVGRLVTYVLLAGMLESKPHMYYRVIEA